MPHIHSQNDFVVTGVIVHNQKVLMVDHKKQKMWLPLGGHVELDEDTDQALFREIEEESGLLEKDLEVLSLKGPFNGRTKSLWVPNNIDIHPISDTHKHIGLVYYLRSKTDKLSLAATEHHDIRWLSKEELSDPKYKLDEAIFLYCNQALEKAGLNN